SRETCTQPASVTCLPISVLRNELQSCVPYIDLREVVCHSGRSEKSRKRLGRDGSPSRPTCCRREFDGHPGRASLPEQLIDPREKITVPDQLLFGMRYVFNRDL